MELSEFDLQYEAHPAIKSQILADFVIECTLPSKDVETEQETLIEDSASKTPSWTLYIDESSTSSINGAGVILISLDEVTFEYAL